MYEIQSPSNICLIEYIGVGTAALLKPTRALAVQALIGMNEEGRSVINIQLLLISNLSVPEILVA